MQRLMSGLSLREEPPRLITPEEFEAELAVLGLSGRQFGPEHYAEALERYLGIRIILNVIPDLHYPELSRALARSGKLAELHYVEDPADGGGPLAVILVPGSLPQLALKLAALHELSHLAAGHVLTGPRKKVARSETSQDADYREAEADMRACYALIAGSLGLSSPHAQEAYDPLS